jgi:hypothetical protein
MVTGSKEIATASFFRPSARSLMVHGKRINVWGFEQVGGERRHTGRVKVTNNSGEEVKVRMMYDYEGE